MKSIMKLAVVGSFGLVLLSSSAMDALAADATGNVSATISTPIVVTEDTAMTFATILRDPAGDTVTLTPVGGISASGGSTFSGTAAAGAFSVTGDPSTAVTISFSSGDTLTGPGTAMPLGTFAHNAGGSPAFNGSGSLSFNVGAALTINAAQAAGAYSGTYTVSVNY